LLRAKLYNSFTWTSCSGMMLQKSWSLYYWYIKQQDPINQLEIPTRPSIDPTVILQTSCLLWNNKTMQLTNIASSMWDHKELNQMHFNFEVLLSWNGVLHVLASHSHASRVYPQTTTCLKATQRVGNVTAQHSLAVDAHFVCICTHTIGNCGMECVGVCGCCMHICWMNTLKYCGCYIALYRHSELMMTWMFNPLPTT